MSDTYDDEIERLRDRSHADAVQLRGDIKELAVTLRAIEIRIERVEAKLAPLASMEDRIRVLERAQDRVVGFAAAVAALAGAAGATAATAFARLLG